MSKKKLHIEHRKSPRYNPEPGDAEGALFFTNEITIKFPCDSVEREVTDLSETGLKVFLEDDDDPLIQLIGKKVKTLLALNDVTLPVRVSVIHRTEDDYGLSYVGCRFDKLDPQCRKMIVSFLKVRKR